jgi:serine/threonine protein kinase
MSQNSSPDVQPVRDNNGPSSSGASELHTFFSEWCEAKRYTVQEVIGKGSYGVVCAAVDNATGEKVAIKKIQNVFENVADATRILREIKLVRLLKHPGERRLPLHAGPFETHATAPCLTMFSLPPVCLQTWWISSTSCCLLTRALSRTSTWCLS